MLATVALLLTTAISSLSSRFHGLIQEPARDRTPAQSHNGYITAAHCYVCVIAPRHIQSISTCSRPVGQTNRRRFPCRVYVRNLEERVKPEPLKQALRAIFSEYGNVIDIVAKTNLRAKGQAFVVFDKPESALAAIEDVQGFELFDKPMQVALARSRSDATVMQAGNEDEFDAHKRRRMAEKGLFFLFVFLLGARGSHSPYFR